MAADRSVPPLSIVETRSVIRASIRTKQALQILGPPGIGKSSVVVDEGRRLGLPTDVISCGLLDPVDVGGIPVVDRSRRRVLRHPLGPVRAACERPGVLFLDEFNLGSPAVQAACMRGVLERVFGDDRLHPGSAVILAANPPEQAAGSFQITAPMLNRLVVIQMMPTPGEIRDYFETLGKTDSTLRRLGAQFVELLEHKPGLLELEPPEDTDARPWGSPRAWERALRMLEDLQMSGDDTGGRSLLAALAGCVGMRGAHAALNHLGRNWKTPPVREITRDPENALVPDAEEGAAAVLGLLHEVAKTDPCAAWIYAARLTGEAQAAALQALAGVRPAGRRNSSRLRKAVHARSRILASHGRRIGGAARGK